MMGVFFSLPNQYPPAGLFSAGHLLLLVVTVFCIAFFLWLSRGMSEFAVRRTVRAVTALLFVLEGAKILFVLFVVRSRNPNEFLPLYYCSIILYAGLFSSLDNRFWRHVGDAFIVMGGMVGGAVFLLMPTTSLPQYPTFHFISWHSFFLHGAMIYLGLLLLFSRMYHPKITDIRPVAALSGTMCAIAFVFNTIYNRVAEDPVANLMFISRDFEGTPLSLIYRLCGPFFTPVMWLGQMFLPFFVTFLGISLAKHLAVRHRKTAPKFGKAQGEKREK